MHEADSRATHLQPPRQERRLQLHQSCCRCRRWFQMPGVGCQGRGWALLQTQSPGPALGSAGTMTVNCWHPSNYTRHCPAGPTSRSLRAGSGILVPLSKWSGYIRGWQPLWHARAQLLCTPGQVTSPILFSQHRPFPVPTPSQQNPPQYTTLNSQYQNASYPSNKYHWWRGRHTGSPSRPPGNRWWRRR